MEVTLEQVVLLGLDMKEGIKYTGGREKYLSALQRFCKASENNKNRIRECLERGDLPNLTIVVHALKSNSKMIGAQDLSDKFEFLELAAKKGDAEKVREGLRPALREYRFLLEGLRPFREMDDYMAPGELTPEEARAVADELLEALEEFDDERASDLAEKLAGFPFRITQMGKLKRAANRIDEFLYDEAADLIKEIYPEIKGV